MKIQSPEILVATHNPGKIREFKDLLDDKTVVWRSLSEFPTISEVAETGTTFAENADLKASNYALETNLLTLADDSGLEVAALGGAPGVFSARYGGKELTDAQRTEKLLAELAATKKKDRRARFVCVISLANKNGQIIYQKTGICEGQLSLTSLGSSGFGYDPVFVPDGFNQTFAQLPLKIKNKISHRARAVQQISRFLRDFLNVSLDQPNEHR